ncbi:MAG: multicopper oxidase domain-containing protein, partial [Gammaproteobacteria bacterium]
MGAGGSTIFHVKIPGTSMQMVHVEGNDVKPYPINDFRISPGETYDVLVRIKKNDPYIIYAESIDTVGAAYGALVTSPLQFVNYKQVSPFPEPLPVTREMMAMMMGDMNNTSSSMNMTMNAPSTSKKESQINSMGLMHHEMKRKNSQTMDMNSSSHSMDSRKSHHMTEPMSHEMMMNHNKDSSSDSQSMSNLMKMDPNMKMDETMPMDHSMSMSNQKKLHKKSQTTMTMDASSSHSMKRNSQTSQNMDSMSDNMKMDLKTDHGMAMNAMSMSMPTEPTIIGDKISTPNPSHSMMKMSGVMSMDHSMAMDSQSMSSENTTPGTKYQNLVAAIKTNDPSKPVDKIIKMELFGYMDRFIWFINGVPEYNAHPIRLEPGKRYRIIFTNTSMMHHPMHIHG